MSNFIKEFREFVDRGNVIDLAVAVVLAAAFAPVITALVDGIIMQIIALIVGEPNFSGLTFTISDTPFFYGAVITAIISFVAIAFAVFAFVVKPWNAIQARKKVEEEAPAGPTEVELLTEIRDALRRQG